MAATTQKKKTDVRMIRTDNIVSQSAIARRFGVTEQAAWNWTRRSDFPQALPGTDAGRPLWDWEDVQEWEKNWVRSKGGYHTHRNHSERSSNGTKPRRQWMEGDPE